MACFFSAVALVTIPLIPVVLFVVWLVAGKILAAMSAQLLTQKLVVKRGILFKEEKSIPLEKITDVGLNQGPLMRFFGLYRLSFETAGQSGHGALVSLLGVENASEFREAILEQKDNLAAQTPKVQELAEDHLNQALLARLVEVVERIDTRLAALEAKR
ncbi:PH domain-containing protein [Pseudoalteromonas agarivorans]|nr:MULTISPECIES: PH domain-containing protein [Pseudoalteromonas]